MLKLKAKLKMLTGRSNGMGYERRKVALHQVIRGLVSYFKYADAKTSLASNDKLHAAGYPCLMDYYVRLHVR
ncbi:MAG: group II intron maturase-specific domain-containing protein [Anaerovoracaceae bacterium]